LYTEEYYKYDSLRVEGDDGTYIYALVSGTRFGEEISCSYRVRVLLDNYFTYRYGHEASFLFGTNQKGQDILTRLAAGARFSLILAICISAVNLFIGAIYGAIEGFYGGVTDLVMERISDILSGMPSMVVMSLFQLHLASKVGPVWSMVFAFVLTGWIGMAARTRMQFYRFKRQEYVLSARTLGASDGRLMFKHIFPNAMGTLITGSVLMIPGVIFSESSLTYLGIVNLESSTETSVGTLLSKGNGMLSTFPHIIFWPAIFISLLEISFNLFGNGLRDAFNPSLKGIED
jgi:oligopeptide transport system permease protein